MGTSNGLIGRSLMVESVGVRRPAKLLAALLVFMMTPGLTELVDDALHLVETGHTEHAAAHDDGHGEDAEHGCSGAFHTCGCHASPAFLPAPEAPSLPESAQALLAVVSPGGGPSDGASGDLLRPPAA
jgi:hypothetical protein